MSLGCRDLLHETTRAELNQHPQEHSPRSRVIELPGEVQQVRLVEREDRVSPPGDGSDRELSGTEAARRFHEERHHLLGLGPPSDPTEDQHLDPLDAPPESGHLDLMFEVVAHIASSICM